MIENFYEYLLFVVINIFDIGFFYFVVHNIVVPRNKWLKIKQKNTLPPLTLKVIILGLMNGVVIGYIAYLFPEEIMFRLIAIILGLSILKLVTKEQWGNVIIIYTMFFLSISTIQAFIILPLQLLEIPTLHNAVISQFLGFILCAVLYRKISLHKSFIFVKNKLSWIDLVILTFFITFLSFAYFSLAFEGIYIVIPAVISITVIIGVYKFLNHSQKLGLKFHHTESVYEGLDYLLKTEKNMQKIQQYYTSTLKKIGFKMPETHFQSEKEEENLIEFIESKKINQGAKMEIVKNIKFYWENRVVEPNMMIYMLSTLLNNAFDTKTKKPLFVEMRVAAHELEITVSNESANKEFIEIEEMFYAGSSAKKGNHGYGLPNLLALVKSYGGTIAVHCDYKPEYKSHYLNITINIKQFNL